MKTNPKPLFFILLTLQLIDITLTHYGLTIGCTELNPLYNTTNEILKIPVTFLLLSTYYIADKTLKPKDKTTYQKFHTIIITILTIQYLIVTANNIYAITQALPNFK
ncbi:MAG: hypothetical protein KIH10_16310 [Candidatus Freyarchaeota archaeon]|nr:hypothetical protein [Candidatus Jordarchaeia archaeon]MBS7281151.1 hypothetical protein [Candidatus Jordarchaeia archaeon]